jgi:prepilin-type N-terminal cleavage/methylation domain-containing protein/prepilin-type processing-associated H-X9-DG protein
MLLRRAYHGFTLVELMVVVAIIALLISILLPSLAKAREQAKATVCGTQLKGIFSALYMYAQDNRDQLPNFNEWWINRGRVERGFWSDRLMPYVRDAKIYLCPADQRPDWHMLDPVQVLAFTYQNTVTSMTGRIGDPVYNKRGGEIKMAPVSYVGNCNSWYKKGGSEYHARFLTRFKYPAFFPLLGEGDRGKNSSSDERYQCMEFVQHFCGAKVYQDPESGWTRHDGGSNMLFVDGHVGYFKPNSLRTYCTRTEYPDFAESRTP